MSTRHPLFTVYIGSVAHGLTTSSSDLDVRSVSLADTRDLLALNSQIEQAPHVPKGVDLVDYELGHFLRLATKSNPSILDIFMAPLESVHHPDGHRVRALFDSVWSSKGVENAFCGYILSQRSKLSAGKLASVKVGKLGAAAMRVAFYGTQLLTTGRYVLKLPEESEIEHVCRRWKEGLSSQGNKGLGLLEVMEQTKQAYLNFQQTCEEAQEKLTDIQPVNDLLLEMRLDNFRTHS